MKGLWICGVLCLFSVIAVYGSEPPMITEPLGNYWAKTTEYVRETAIHVAHCHAKADPVATYTWTLNGVDINNIPGDKTNVVKYDPVSGNLTVGPNFKEEYDGVYQCFAKNSIGRAMTPFLTILRARYGGFVGGSETRSEVKDAFLSDYVVLKCEGVPFSVPAWEYSWSKLVQDGEKVGKVILPMGDRMVIDKNGSLHMLWTEKEDDGNILACSTKNTEVLIELRNTHTITLRINPKDQIFDRNIMKLVDDDVTVIAGDEAKLTCIFTYYSKNGNKLKVDWYYRGDVIGHGFHHVIKKTFLPNETFTQEGEYLCKATVDDGELNGKVNLRIFGPPHFPKDKKITSRTVPDGQDTVFLCDAYSHNSYAQPPTWLVNTEPILGCMPGEFECVAPLPNGLTRCLSSNKVCDSVPDCDDGSDESSCPRTCGETQISCNLECIPAGETCAPKQCEFPRFLCPDMSTCLNDTYVCNAAIDCPDKSDERACEKGEDINIKKYVINSQRTQLKIPKVTKQDMNCFQCMVTNEYGTSISDGCLTVRDKIVIKVGPNSTYYVEPGSEIVIEVIAVTDQLLQKQMKYHWYWYETRVDKDTGDEITVQVELPTPILQPYIRTPDNGRIFKMRFPLVKEFDKEALEVYNLMKDRKYSLIVSHTSDEVIVDFMVEGRGLATPKPDPIIEQASANLWFIALILAILILFIVVALIVCYMYRNRGGTYPLDKKEHQAGHDPEKELKNNGFNDVGRIDDDYEDKPLGDETSLSESVKPYESDDDPTEEYGGDFDVSKFNEDGSFIGLYGDKKSKYPSEAKEATV